MKTYFTTRTLLPLLIVLLFFVSCKDDDPTPAPAGTLTAKAGSDQTVQLGQTITLDGSASTDSQNKAFTYQWAFTQKPAGSNASLSNATTASPSFVADATGTYEAELTIASEREESKDKVLITATAVDGTSLTLPEYISTATVLEDRIADPNVPDYIAPKTVIVSAALTIKPGVIIAFASDTRFDIQSEGGEIIARGTAEEKIRFTGKESSKGYWRGLVIYSASSANVLEHVEISYAGSYFTLNDIKAGLTLFGNSGALLSLLNCTLHHNDGYGLHAAAGAQLKNFANNTFVENSEAPLLLAADNVKQLDAASVLTGNNGRNMVEITASSLTAANGADNTWAGFADKTPYRLLGELRVNTGLRLMPGVQLEVGSDQLIMIEEDGYLNAVGTPDNKISIRGAIPSAGYWRGIAIYSTAAQNELSQVALSHGGSNALISGKKALVALMGSGAKLMVEDSQLSASTGYGIYVRSGSSLNADASTANAFEDIAQQNVFSED